MTYSNNIGLQEMIQFTQKASTDQQAKMDQAVRDENWAEYKELIATVLGIELN
jgi:hypothetical protein